MIVNFQNCCPGKYFDFVTLKIAVPVNAVHWGFTGASSLFTDVDGFQEWTCVENDPSFSRPWHGTYRTTTTFNNGCVVVVELKARPWFLNLADQTPVALGWPGAAPNDPNPAHDFRLTGFGGGIEYTSQTTVNGHDTVPTRASGISPHNIYVAAQSQIPPVITATSALVYCEGSGVAFNGTTRLVTTFLIEVFD